VRLEPVPVGLLDFEAVFRRETEQLLLEWLRRGLAVGIVLYAVFALLDHTVAPGQLSSLLAVRGLVIFLAVLTIAFSYSEKSKDYLVPVSVGMLYVAATGISVMTTRLGGFSSNYYFGILLVLFFVGLFMPWTLRVTVLFCALVCISYFLLNLTAHGPSPIIVSPALFLLSTSVFTCLASAAGNRSRRRDLALRLRLQEANEELTRIDAAKTRFFANVSHELRTPLTLMLGPVEALLREEIRTERKTLLHSVRTNSRRLLRQVNLLLDTAKLESGRLVLEPEEGDLAKLLLELVDASAPHAENRGLDLRTEGLEELSPFAFDRAKMEMIAANLLSNALKFTPEGGRIVLRAESNEDSVIFEVEDTGPGIPEDQRELIFDRFHQVDTSLSREEGTGLGLSLARELARLHGGDLTVKSEEGKGSTFRVEVPCHGEHFPLERRRASRRKEDQLIRARADALTAREYEVRSKSDTLLADLRSPHISQASLAKAVAPPDAPQLLIVEDNSDLRAFLESQLSRQYRVATAKNGVEGLQRAHQVRPALVVSDIMMPKMDGYEFCRRLRADPGLAAIPVILVTAKAGSEAIVEGLEIGADDYVTKPFSVEELEARIAANLRAKETEKALHERESRLAAIGQLTSTVVHDLRNALTLIQGYSDLARSTAAGGGKAEDVVEELDQIGGATRRLRRMTSEILEFARGGGELNRQKIAARAYLMGLVESFAAHLGEQGIEVESQIDVDSELSIWLDPDGFQRVVENLVLNARDAVLESDGERKLVIQAGRRGDTLEVRVADTGPGISGLGLVTVRNLVKAHGGDVRVEPKSPEGGAAFTVVLPLRKSRVRQQEDRKVTPIRVVQ
jgi:signal transduction histidine kinase